MTCARSLRRRPSRSSRSSRLISANTPQSMVRVFPDGLRFDSSNPNPLPFWAVGMQMVALNYQTVDRPNELNEGKFLQNGRCGYILKPVQFRNDVSSSVIVSRTQLTIVVIQGYGLPTSRTSKKRIPDPYIEVEVCGVSTRICSTKAHDKTDSPVFNESFDFDVFVPEISLVRFVSYDEKTATAQATIPVDSLVPGYRRVTLKRLTPFGRSEPVEHAWVLVHVTIKPQK
eukprot:Opistho-2@22079